MKHVFVINSHTTFLTSMGTVDYLRLRDKDVILLMITDANLRDFGWGFIHELHELHELSTIN